MQPFEATFDQIKRENANRAWVRYWLYAICLLVAAMVIVGGATRLTDSGLSITEWKPLLGIFPPWSQADWMIEFEKYKKIPEYTQINNGMSLAGFKAIYWWEWAHRFLGRMIGFVFAIPLAIFWFTRRLEKSLKPRLLFLLVLGGFQGFIGWWMVSSGLVERTDVSQYRLAVHLIVACLIFAYALWIARALTPHSQQVGAPKALQNFAPIMVLVIFLQIFLGALVAGLDAGLAFNDWPLMDGAIIPQSLFVETPWWLNFIENPKLVQYTHRTIAYFLGLIILANFLIALRANSHTTHFRRSVLLLLLVLVQLALGVMTLMAQVPINLALLHQLGAIILLGFAIAHWRAFKGSYISRTSVEVGD